MLEDQSVNLKKENLEKLYSELQSTSKMAVYLDVNKKTVLNYMNKFGIPRNIRDGNITRKAIVELAKEGKNSTEICRELKISQVHARRIAIEEGIKLVDTYHRGFTISHNGYILVKRPEHPNANKSGYIQLHRIIIEESLGRLLSKNEIVHHANEDKQDNRLENLELMNRFQHMRLHHKKVK